MAFVDELTVYARAGRGGDGVVRWLHLKGKEFSGPAGGNGGDGGDVYIRGVRDMGLLARYRGEKKFEAGDGRSGESASRNGARGADITIDLPVGSLVKNRETGEAYDILAEGESHLVLKGGRGGAGNAVFKSSVNRTPQESTPGLEGESTELDIQLRLIADIGLVGLPNAGKTSLLNALTGSTSKVGSYAFTTLEPNLGALHGLVLADIPGLIEGAADGRGLGFKFLRHVARTRLLVHCVSLEAEHPLEDYKTVRNELSRFEGGVLAEKPEILVLTKSDTREEEYIKRVRREFKEIYRKESSAVSVLDDGQIQQLQKIIAAGISM